MSSLSTFGNFSEKKLPKCRKFLTFLLPLVKVVKFGLKKVFSSSTQPTLYTLPPCRRGGRIEKAFYRTIFD